MELFTSNEKPTMQCACLFCLSVDGAHVSVSKRNRPVISCQRCGARTFINTREGLTGLALIGRRLADILKTEAGKSGMSVDDVKTAATKDGLAMVSALVQVPR
jgi:transcription elongation factor Elf1